MTTIIRLIKKLLKEGFRLVVRFLIDHPKIHSFLSAMVRATGLKAVTGPIARRLTGSANKPAYVSPYHCAPDAEGLPPRARRIYEELKQTIERNKREAR